MTPSSPGCYCSADTSLIQFNAAETPGFSHGEEPRLRRSKKRKKRPARSPSNAACGIEFLFIPHSALEAPPDTILRNRATSSHAFAYLAVDFLGQAVCQWQQVAVDQRGSELTWSTALLNPQQARGSFRPACGIERREFQDCSTGAWPEGRCGSSSERNSPRSAISRGSRESSRIAIASISPKNWRRGSTRDFRSCSAGSLSESRKIRSRTVSVGSSSRRFRSFKILRNSVQTSISAR